MYDAVYVYYPRGKQSGGPEALHQLVDSLRRQGVAAYLVAYPHSVDKERVQLYARYDAPEAPRPEDRSGMAIVAGESQYPLLSAVKRATVFCWWLAIESSYLYQSTRIPYLRRYESPRNRISGAWRDAAIRGRGAYRRFVSNDSRFVHLTQSQYAWSFLADRKMNLPTMLSDYTPRVEEIAIHGAREGREPSVSFNAVKAGHLTRQVAALCPDVSFVPIQGMSPNDVYRALGRSSIYLDLGAHPGKDRIPREAAVAGCVVSVALRGAGAFTADVPIPFSHKVRVDGDVVHNAVTTLRGLIECRQQAFAAQEPYRLAIARERSTFDAEVRAIFIDGLRGYDAEQSFAFSQASA